MNTLRILVVDNNDSFRNSLMANFGDQSCFYVIGADSVDSAIEAISTDFFHLAFVDLKLNDFENFDSGFEVLQFLKEVQPQCERIAMSRFATTKAFESLKAVNPSDTPAHSLFAKPVLQPDDYLNVANKMRSRISAPNIIFDGLDEILDVLGQDGRIFKGTGRTKQSISAEIEFLLIGLLRPRIVEDYGQPTIVQLSLTTQGFSGAVAITCSPTYDGQPGGKCFVKIGRRAAIDSEAQRFRGFVELNVPLSVRVELLDSVLGSALGAVGYSFAGGDAAGLKSLDQLAADSGIDSDEVLTALKRLFDPDTSRWYRTTGKPIAPLYYFEGELRAGLLERQPKVRGICKNLASKYKGQFEIAETFDGSPSKLKFGTVTLSVPNDQVLGRPIFTETLGTCLSHGDMHGANVLVPQSGEVYLIDFSHAGFAPFAIDAAVMSGSIRLWDSSRLVDLTEVQLMKQLAGIVESERNLSINWAGATNGRNRRNQEPWETTAANLDDKLYTVFQGDISADHVRAVYLLQAARLLTLPVGDLGRLRLLAWFTGVLRSLDEATGS